MTVFFFFTFLGDEFYQHLSEMVFLHHFWRQFFSEWGTGGNSLVIQWLRLCALTARGLGSIPGHGTMIPQNECPYPRGKKKRIGINSFFFFFSALYLKFFFFKFYWGDSSFTILCYFQVYSKVNLLYIYPLFLILFS